MSTNQNGGQPPETLSSEVDINIYTAGGEVGLPNYIKTDVMNSIERRPHARVTAIVGRDGKWIEYSLEQYEGLVLLMAEKLVELRAAVQKYEQASKQAGE